MRITLAALTILLAGCDDTATVWIPLDGYKPYKQEITKKVCAQFPFPPDTHASHNLPQIDIIRDKCTELKYPLSIEKDPNFTPQCSATEPRIPEGYHSCWSSP